MNVESYRELKVLEELATNSQLTQRHLAKELGVALGLTNLMLRRFIKKGHIKVVNLQRQRIQYLLTAQGIAEKTRLTYEYLEYSLYLYRNVRHVLRASLQQIVQSGGRNVVIFGTGEIAEIAYLTLRELGLNLTGIIDDQEAGRTFLGFPVLDFQTLATLPFDCGIISAMDHEGIEGARRRLQKLGISDNKMIEIEQTRSEIRRVVPVEARSI